MAKWRISTGSTNGGLKTSSNVRGEVAEDAKRAVRRAIEFMGPDEHRIRVTRRRNWNRFRAADPSEGSVLTP
jgi:hypothetical protein